MVMTLAARLEHQADPPRRPDPEVATEIDTVWARSRTELRAMSDRLRSPDQRRRPDEPALVWQQSIRDLGARLRALTSGGASSSPGAEASLPGAESFDHALSRCLHLHLNRLGVSARQEARLRRLADRAVVESGE